jgi:ABC-type phosphate transport system ATPase subunit
MDLNSPLFDRIRIKPTCEEPREASDPACERTGCAGAGLYRAPKGRADELLERVGLTEAAGRKVKTYSTGMKARLGFAIATSVEPDILLLDEVLSTGDASFREKSKARVLELVQSVGFRPVDAGPLAAARMLEGMAWLNIARNINGGSWQSAWLIVDPTEEKAA